MAQAPSFAKANLSHEERTANEPRAHGLHPVTIDRVSQVNSQIRTYRLITEESGINFLAGQWLDVHVPGIQKAGGFTITSPPRHASPIAARVERPLSARPFLELAVQRSPENPPAAWLWQPIDDVVGKQLHVRVGGTFVWPPPGINKDAINRVVFIAGGVGINPLISIVDHILGQAEPEYLDVRFLYATKAPRPNAEPSEILSLPRLIELFWTPDPAADENRNRLDVFFTSTIDKSCIASDDTLINSLNEGSAVQASARRIDRSILIEAIGTRSERERSVFYVCGPPDMTDSIVDFVCSQDNVTSKHVLCEKWW
ncbi:hypothetical protein EJ04DRAFT_530519 [Polyplosphaeria fusca]|uniref:FAD-binding FR-type domain-containing protein n=1 Tax=Polyplosphaeria fusca TaxID=682080 RepID=A0A9P4RDP5_9PLEO|nr:hypothetical protein EJ04DRAFT_530519 [Polyplosphaeria fusca]